MSQRKPPGYEPPASKPEHRTRPYDKAAGGLGAVTSVLKEAGRHTGMVRGMQLLARINQPNGFDCPGCAWPDPPAGERTAFEFCENGAKAAMAEGTKRRVTPAFFKQHALEDLLGRTDHWLEAQGRLTHPMIKRRGATHYEPLSWAEAFAHIAGALNALADPNEAIFYTSGRTSNEAAFLYQAFARHFGTNNMPDCSNMCHESSGRGLGATIGIGKGTVSLEDFYEADAIVVIGQNPGTNHPRMLSALELAKKNGAKVVSINPLLERGLERFGHPQKPTALLGASTSISDLYLQVRINGDVALLKGVMKIILEREAQAPGTVLDHAFIEQHTVHFEDFKAALEAQPFEPLVEQSGIARAQMEELADLYIASEATIVCWAMGLTQHKNGVANIQEVVNLLLLRGNLGKPGAGACPVRGHSNVQGDRTMGIVERPKLDFLERLDEALGIQSPRAHGVDVVEAIHAMAEGRAKVFFAMGGNFVAATPDTHYTEEALRRCALTVQVSTKLNRSHLVAGEEAIILPCLGRSEVDRQRGGSQFVTCENSMGIVTRSQGFLKPASEQLLSEPAIVAGLAQATLGTRSQVDWAHLVADYDRIRSVIEQVIPGFEGYNARARQPSGFVLPNGVRERVWNTASERAEFTVHGLPDLVLKDDQYLMATVRSHDQYNTTIYGLDDRYRGIYGERRVVMMSPEDIAEAGLSEGQRVDLTSHFDDGERHAPRFVVVAQPVPRRCVFTYFPEANPLVPARSVALQSNTPTSKSVVISMTPSAG